MIEKIIKEPLVHFLLLGGLLFLVYGFLNRNEYDKDDYEIRLTQGDITRIKASYTKNWNAEPDSVTLQNLLEAEVKSEIYYREALRFNLDHNDEIIRRRLKQKYEFLIKDLAATTKPTEKDLTAFYQANQGNYLSPKKISFSQIYFSPDKHQDPNTVAAVSLKKINQQPYQPSFASLGDDFHLSTYYGSRAYEAIWQLFGKAFAEVLFQQNEIGWYRMTSGYGQHLVYISGIEAAEKLAYGTIKEALVEDWKNQQMKESNRRLYEALREQYQVVYE